MNKHCFINLPDFCILFSSFLQILWCVLTIDTKLEEYVEKIKICGEDRNSYSKTDHSATFMRIKTDYMGNDQLLPAYNVQVGVADEYIAVVDVNQYRSDMDCFIPLMNKFYTTYGLALIHILLLSVRINQYFY